MTVQSIHRAARLLRALADEQGPRRNWSTTQIGSRLSDLARAADLDKATAHRLLASLVEEGLVEADSATRRYHLGLELFVLGTAVLPRFNLRDVAAPSLTRLAQETGDTVYLSIRQETQAVCLDRREGSFPIKSLPLDIGSRRPLGIGAGSLALLAFQSDAFVAQAVDAGEEARLTFGPFTAEKLWRMVRHTRERGHAINPGETVPGMSAVGVPILSSRGTARAAISIAAITERLEGERLQRAVALLHQESRRIAAALGDEPNPKPRKTAASKPKELKQLEKTGG